MQYLFYDYETTGTSHLFDQVLQFAAIRTDSNFSMIGEPINIFCKLREDILPSPMSIKITEIDLEFVENNGLTEFEFAKRVEQELRGNGNQCIIGYNSKQFDDKFSQFLFYRNFIDPYLWFYDNNNSKLDLYDIILMGYSFNKLKNIKFNDGESEDSLKLEKLSSFNKLTHTNAHDALSDVIATIELMKLVKAENSQLIEYALTLRNKSYVNSLINQHKKFFRISSFNGYENKFISLHYAIESHPTNKNTYISWDLKCNPELILARTPEEIRQEMFAKTDDRTIDVGFTEIKMNQNPTIIAANEHSSHPHIDQNLVSQNLEKVLMNMDKLKELSRSVYQYTYDLIDADADLYAGKFFNEKEADKNLIHNVYSNPMSVQSNSFNSERFMKLHKRLLGRNFYHQLAEKDKKEFDLFCKIKFNYKKDDKWRTLDQFNQEFKETFNPENLSEKQINALQKLQSIIQNKMANKI